MKNMIDMKVLPLPTTTSQMMADGSNQKRMEVVNKYPTYDLLKPTECSPCFYAWRSGSFI